MIENPNLAWILACVFCYAFGVIAAQENVDNGEKFRALGFTLVLCVLIYGAISYVLTWKTI